MKCLPLFTFFPDSDDGFIGPQLLQKVRTIIAADGEQVRIARKADLPSSLRRRSMCFRQSLTRRLHLVAFDFDELNGETTNALCVGQGGKRLTLGTIQIGRQAPIRTGRLKASQSDIAKVVVGIGVVVALQNRT